MQEVKNEEFNSRELRKSRVKRSSYETSNGAALSKANHRRQEKFRILSGSERRFESPHGNQKSAISTSLPVNVYEIEIERKKKDNKIKWADKMTLGFGISLTKREQNALGNTPLVAWPLSLPLPLPLLRRMGLSERHEFCALRPRGSQRSCRIY